MCSSDLVPVDLALRDDVACVFTFREMISIFSSSSCAMPSIAGDAVFSVMSGTLVVYTCDAILLVASSAVAKLAGPRFMPWALLAP